MSVAFADKQSGIIGFSKFYRKRLVEAGALRANINNHIEYMSLNTTNQLIVSGFTNLKMHTAQNANFGAGEKRLRWPEINALSLQCLGMKKLCEVSTMIRKAGAI